MLDYSARFTDIFINLTFVSNDIYLLSPNPLRFSHEQCIDDEHFSIHCNNLTIAITFKV